MTMTEPSLFDAPATAAPSRRSDPATSRAAGRQLKLRERQAEVLRALRHRQVASTPEQVRSTLAAYGMHRERNEVASRLAEMASTKHMPDGIPLVSKAGTRKNHRGRDVATWALTPAGLRVAKDLDS